MGLKQLQVIYRKYYNCITKWIFPIILLIYPLIKINQGVDVSDSTYSLGNYLFFERLEGTWVISTYLSNVVGWLFTKLPFGTTLLGMNLYTGLVVSGLAIGLYFLLRKWMPDWIVFIGEFVAIGFLWIPTGILYNYLTYVFFSMGAVLLYKGLVEENNKWLAAAGIMLGLNVWVRIPNLAEMALIVCVWYYSYLQKDNLSLLSSKKQRTVLVYAVEKTGFCVAGYITGVVVPLIFIVIQYGFRGIAQMIQGLSQIQSGDDSYSIFSMIQATMDAYIRSGKWVAFIVAGIVLGLAMFAIQKKRFLLLKKGIYLLGIAVLLRFFWGRGMFSFRYYEDYTSMYEWGMIGLYLGIVSCVYLFIGKGVSVQERLWGMISLVILCITPLGSNNYTYQNLNNLFLIAPITLYAFVKCFRRRYPEGKRIYMFPWKAMVAVLGCMILVQSFGFHMQFVFRDGMDGTKRDTVVTENRVTAGMKTTKANAENLSGLFLYIQTEKVEEEAVYFGDCPGLSFLLLKPAAIDSTWPDLDSNSIDWFEKELLTLQEKPVIIMRHTEPSSQSFVPKKELLEEYISENQYMAVYENDGYTVYRSPEK